MTRAATCDNGQVNDVCGVAGAELSDPRAYIVVIWLSEGQPVEVSTVLAELEVRCGACRDGLTVADQWCAWYARADEIEVDSEEWLAHLEERPDVPEEVECAECSGTGVILTAAGREVLVWAQRRLFTAA